MFNFYNQGMKIKKKICHNNFKLKPENLKIILTLYMVFFLLDIVNLIFSNTIFLEKIN